MGAHRAGSACACNLAITRLYGPLVMVRLCTRHVHSAGSPLCSRLPRWGLKRGQVYFVQIRATNSAGYGPKGTRVAHETIAAQASLPAGSPQHRVMTWNICSNACSSIATRARVINQRITEVKPDLVAMQEASRYTKAPAGYRHVHNGQADILVRKGVYSLVSKNSKGRTTGTARFASKYATSGKGMAWAALKHKTGSYMLVVNTHLVYGNTTSAVKQREYEAGRLPYFLRNTLRKLNATHGHVTDWTKAPVVVLGDFNTHKSRSGDDSQQILENMGWHDSYDQARRLSGQHRNTANPDFSTTPVIGGVWGDHVDKVLVKPRRTVVYGWANVGKMKNGKYVAPLGSDHHPLVVRLGLA